MSSKVFKYSKIKNLNDVDFISENKKRNQSEVNTTHQIWEDLARSKENVLSLVSASVKEYFLRVKLEKEISTLYNQQTSVSYKLSELHRKLEAVKEEKENRDCSRDIHSLNLYEQNLAIRVEPASDTPVADNEVAVTFDFHHINESNPEETCSLVLKITDGSTYKASSCHPPVAEMNELISRLNKTNDLHKFIVDLRTKFQESFTKLV